MAVDKPPSFQFYPKDFLSSDAVSLMTTEQIGAYTLLLCHAWLRPEGLPSDLLSLSKLARVPVAMFTKKVWPGLVRSFQANERGLLYNPRMERGRQEAEAYRAERSQSGKRGAATRWTMAQPSNQNGSAINQPLAKNSSSSSTASASTATKDVAVVAEPPPPPRLMLGRNPDRMTIGPVVLWASWFRDDLLPVIASHFGGNQDAARVPALEWISEIDAGNVAAPPSKDALNKPREWWKARVMERWAVAQSVADDPWLKVGK